MQFSLLDKLKFQNCIVNNVEFYHFYIVDQLHFQFTMTINNQECQNKEYCIPL